MNYVEVSGTAKMEVVPDRIYLRIIINETDSKGKIAVHNQEQDMINALKTIRDINITEDLAMKDLESRFKYRKILDNQILLSKVYELTVKSGKTASEVMTKLETAGISSISLTKIDHSQIEQFRKTTLENAIKEAKLKASSLAESIGQSIGKAIHINERQIYSANRSELYLSKSAAFETAGEYTSEVEFSKIKIEATVDVKFELK
ncbi:MAG: SIMPL domain-containing protein [Bacteroidales bacterium]|nr:SIMPL domain-containing protein [Bacteroidales bacterium]